MASWFATQATFSFVVAPFVILRLDHSLQAWGRVYFYAILTTGATLAFFASPAKAALRKKLEARTKEAGVRLVRSASTDSLTAVGSRAQEPVLGLSADPGRDIDEAIQELRGEVEKAQARLREKERQQQQQKQGGGGGAATVAAREVKKEL